MVLDKSVKGQAAPGKRKGPSGVMRDSLELLLLDIPTTIWYLIFCYAPMFGVLIAFKNYKVKAGKSFLYSLFVNSKWCGLNNFKFLFNSSSWSNVVRLTLSYNFVFIVLGVLIPVTLAILINEMYSKKLAKVCQTMMFLPHFLSWVVVSYFVFAFLSTDRGLLNRVLLSMGLISERQNWYMNVGFWRYFIVFLNLWKTLGYSMVVYLASITGIDHELYEAALIDGATKWQQVKSITLPLLRPIISIMFIMNMGSIFRSDFGLFYQATRNSGSLASVTTTIDVYVYKALIDKPNINYSSAASVVQSVFGLICIVIANLVVKKIDPDAGLF